MHLRWGDGEGGEASDPGDGGGGGDDDDDAGGDAESSTRQHDSGLAKRMSLLKSILKDQGMTASNMPKEIRL